MKNLQVFYSANLYFLKVLQRDAYNEKAFKKDNKNKQLAMNITMAYENIGNIQESEKYKKIAEKL